MAWFIGKCDLSKLIGTRFPRNDFIWAGLFLSGGSEVTRDKGQLMLEEPHDALVAYKRFRRNRGVPVLIAFAIVYYVPVVYVFSRYGGFGQMALIFTVVFWPSVLFAIFMLLLLLRCEKPWKFYEKGFEFHSLYGKPMFTSYNEVDVAILYLKKRRASGSLTLFSEKRPFWGRKVFGRIGIGGKAATWKDPDSLVGLLRERGVKVKRMGMKEWLRTGY